MIRQCNRTESVLESALESALESVLESVVQSLSDGPLGSSIWRWSHGRSSDSGSPSDRNGEKRDPV